MGKRRNDHKKGKPKGRGKRPNFENATKILGVSKADLKNALGRPPGNFTKAAKKLGISEKTLKIALEVK